MGPPQPDPKSLKNQYIFSNIDAGIMPRQIVLRGKNLIIVKGILLAIRFWVFQIADSNRL